MSRIEKGRLLEIGLQGRSYETKIGIIVAVLTLTGLAMLSFFFAYLAYMGKSSIAGSSELDFIISLIMGIGIVYAILFVGGAEIDAVYENGLTHSAVGLVGKLQGKHWIPWEEVETVYYGNFNLGPERGMSEYIRVVSGDKVTNHYVRSRFDKHNPNFYPLLVKMLRERSPQARWIQKDAGYGHNR